MWLWVWPEGGVVTGQHHSELGVWLWVWPEGGVVHGSIEKYFTVSYIVNQLSKKIWSETYV